MTQPQPTELTFQDSATKIQYILSPSLFSKTTVIKFTIVILLFLFYMIYVIYISMGLNANYTPNFAMFIDFLTENNEHSNQRFNEYIDALVNEYTKTTGKKKEKESFTTLHEDTTLHEETSKQLQKAKEMINIEYYLQKMRDYINSTIIKLFYINGNKIFSKIQL